MKALLIGGSGFIGSSLAERFEFSEIVNSTTPIQSGHFDLVVCAAPSGRKWFANSNPAADLLSIEALLTRISQISADRFVLFSTVDVYESVSDATENSPLATESHPYGFHRALVENVVRRQFNNHLVLRLGGLVGPLLRKNPLFDLKHMNNLSLLNRESRMQFTPIEALTKFVQSPTSDWVGTVNLTAPPISLGQIANGLGISLGDSAAQVMYDVKSNWSKGAQKYLVSRRSSSLAIREYFES